MMLAAVGMGCGAVNGGNTATQSSCSSTCANAQAASCSLDTKINCASFCGDVSQYGACVAQVQSAYQCLSGTTFTCQNGTASPLNGACSVELNMEANCLSADSGPVTSTDFQTSCTNYCNAASSAGCDPSSVSDCLTLCQQAMQLCGSQIQGWVSCQSLETPTCSSTGITILPSCQFEYQVVSLCLAQGMGSPFVL